jgi:hypothetical protein
MMVAVGVLLMAARGVSAQPAQADGPGREPVRTATATRSPVDVRVDGLADDAVWEMAQPIRDFRQYDPEPDAPPTLATEVRAATATTTSMCSCARWIRTPTASCGR